MLQLAWPWVALLAPLPVVVARFLAPARSTPGAALRLPFYDSARAWVADGAAPRARVVLGGVAWLCLVLAACRPQWIGEPIGMPITGRNLLLAVDLSGSMNTADLRLGPLPATRLEVVKEVAGDFVERRRGDRLGLIVFGSRPYLQTPLTFDRATVRAQLEQALIGLAGEQTAIGSAIGLAVKRLRSEPESDRVLVLLTDGANTAGEVAPEAAARLAAAHHVRIHAIGVGAARAPRDGTYGQRVVTAPSELDEDTLREVAATTGGQYFRALDTEDLERIYRLIDGLEPAVEDEALFRPRRELFHWPLAGAAALAGLATLTAVAPGWLTGWRSRAPALREATRV